MKTKNFITSILLFFFFGFPFVFSQTLEDTSKVNHLLLTALKLQKTNPDSSSIIYDTAERIAIEIGAEKTLVTVYFAKAVFMFEKGKNDLALQNFKKSLKIAGQIGDKYYINSSKVYIANIYLFYSNYKLAAEYCLDALKYFELQKNYNAISGIYLQLTFVKYEQKDYKKMKEYIDLSMKYSKLANNNLNLCKSLLNLSQYYTVFDQYEKTLEILRKTLVIAEKIGSKNFIPLVHLDLAEAFVKLNIPDSAKIYLDKVISGEAIPFYVSRSYITYVELYIMNNNPDKALEYAKKGEKYSKNHNIEQDIGTVYQLIAEIYSLKKNYQKAYQFERLASEIKDSIFTKENIRHQNQLEAIYQNNKKQKEIEELSREKELDKLRHERFKLTFYLLSIILFALIIIGALIFKQHKLKSKQKATELEQKLLRTQMNPHFIFNSISAIQNFILKNNPIEASTYLADFANLMRSVLNSSSQNLISLDEDIQLASNYLKLQQLRMQGKFNYEIKIDDNIDTEELNVPPMLTQPFIENAILHGIKPKAGNDGLINISYKLKNGFLIIEIQDNGIGRKQSIELNNSKHKSKAVDITNQRISLLAQKYKQKISFDIIDIYKPDNKAAGTLVRFKLPTM